MKKIISAIMLLMFISTSSLLAGDIFNINTINGKKLTFEGTNTGIKVKEYKDKIVLIEFWGTWCGPCLLSIPHHEEIEEKYKGKVKVIAFETTPKVTAKELQEYVKDPATHIDLSRVDFYLKEKAKTAAQKASLQEPIKNLKAFIASKKPITYDMVAFKDGEDFIRYVAQRANWPGFIPYLLVMNQNGDLVKIVPGMPNGKQLDALIQSLLKK